MNDGEKSAIDLSMAIRDFDELKKKLMQQVDEGRAEEAEVKELVGKLEQALSDANVPKSAMFWANIDQEVDGSDQAADCPANPIFRDDAWRLNLHLRWNLQPRFNNEFLFKVQIEFRKVEDFLLIVVGEKEICMDEKESVQKVVEAIFDSILSGFDPTCQQQYVIGFGST